MRNNLPGTLGSNTNWVEEKFGLNLVLAFWEIEPPPLRVVLFYSNDSIEK